ncbi:MAG: AAA family ATPase [Oscillospiraceae bacterium]|nr:AAA family ATPase [Oscillospiraceae bacterium]
MIEQIIDKINADKKTVMAIDGKCGAGKTTLANKIREIYNCDVICMDDFFLPLDLRTDERLNEPGGNIHYERFIEEVADKIDNTIEYKIFDCSRMDFNGTKTIHPQQLLIVEGSYSLHPKFAYIYNLKVFVDVAEEEQLRRIKKRSPQLYNKFKNIWIPMENRYFAEFKIKESCDVVV